VAVSGLSFGILVYALSVTTSIRTTAALKAGVFVGSDVAVELPPDATTVLDLPFPATTVWIVDRAALLPGGRLVRVVAIDPASFGGAAFWHEKFADRPLRELLRDLSRGDRVRGQRAAAIVAGGPLPRRLVLRIAGWTMPVVVTHEVGAFPGMRSGMPLIVLDRHTLEAKLAGAGLSPAGVGAELQLWAKAAPSAVLAALRSRDVPSLGDVTAARVLSLSPLRPFEWSQRLLVALGASTAWLGIVGMFLYVRSQVRRRRLPYALMRRMGLAARAHLSALLVEAMAIEGAALVIAAVAGGGAAVLVLPLLDPVPQIPPPAVVAWPVTGFVSLVIAATLVAAAASFWAQRTLDGGSLAEVARLGG